MVLYQLMSLIVENNYNAECTTILCSENFIRTLSNKWEKDKISSLPFIPIFMFLEISRSNKIFLADFVLATSGICFHANKTTALVITCFNVFKFGNNAFQISKKRPLQ